MPRQQRPVSPFLCPRTLFNKCWGKCIKWEKLTPSNQSVPWFVSCICACVCFIIVDVAVACFCFQFWDSTQGLVHAREILNHWVISQPPVLRNIGRNILNERNLFQWSPRSALGMGCYKVPCGPAIMPNVLHYYPVWLCMTWRTQNKQLSFMKLSQCCLCKWWPLDDPYFCSAFFTLCLSCLYTGSISHAG